MNPRISRLLCFAVMLICVSWLLFTLWVLVDLQRQDKLFFCRFAKNYIFLNDFVQFYKLSKIASSDQRYQAYSPEVQRQWTMQLVPALKPNEFCFTHNPPQLFVFMGPLARLPMIPAYWLFTIWGALVGLLSLLLLWLRFEQTDKLTTALFLCLVASSAPSWLCLLYGQLSWLELATASLYFRWNCKKDDFLAGIALALSTLKLQYTPFLLLPALACKRYRLLVIAGLAEIAILALAGMTIGFHNVINYPAILISSDANPRYFWMNPSAMICIRGPLSQFLPLRLCVIISFAFALIMAVFLLLLWVKVKQLPSGSNRCRWAIALTVLGALLASPHSHVYDCLLVAIPAAVTLPWMRQQAQTNSLYNRIWYWLLLSYPATSWILALSGNPGKAGFTLLHATLFACAFLNWRLASSPTTRQSQHHI